jgi:hypothetical protein
MPEPFLKSRALIAAALEEEIFDAFGLPTSGVCHEKGCGVFVGCFRDDCPARTDIENG